MNKLRFWIGLFHVLLRKQGGRWRESIRPELRFVLLTICIFQVYVVGLFFAQLDIQAWDYMLGHMFEPLAALCLACSAALGFIGLVFTLMSNELAKSLTE